jgi:hypothetical protein
MKYDIDKEHWESTDHRSDGTILKAYIQVSYFISGCSNTAVFGYKSFPEIHDFNL